MPKKHATVELDTVNHS